MSVKNITAIDIALLELLDGKAEAPPQVFAALKAKGYVALSGGKPSLTASGRARAKAMKPGEHSIRKMFAQPVGGGSPLKLVGGGAFHT